MKGLEISEISIQDIFKLEDYRLEAEFHISKRVKFDSVKGVDVESFSQYGTSKDLNENSIGFPVLRLNEFDSFFISKPAKHCDLIDTETYESLKLKKDDVLICRTNGNPKLVGKAAIVPQDYEYAFASYLFRIRPDINIINSATLVAFLNSRYGRLEIEKYSMVGNQANFSPAKFRQISVPIFSKQFNVEVEKLVYKSFDSSKEGKKYYSEAEEILLSELGIKDWQLNNAQVNIKNLKDSFQASGRLDAEYYQPKYDDYVEFIRDYKNGSDILGRICSLNEKNFNPESDTEYKYIELSNIGNSGEITGCTTAVGAELPSRARRLVHTDDVIVSSIEGSLQSVALITAEYDKAICSTGFYVVKSDNINPETLLVLFKSEPMQNLLKQGCSGTILTAIGSNELQNIVMPKIRKDVQTKIAEYVQKSISLRKEAKQLLENAKLMVENEIEKGGE
ncbi:MAG: hypothetical protein KBT28_12960 [Bacteroidales bacterium]|nr:hypothetical protein [Candidatus Colimorpha merdihippi]